MIAFNIDLDKTNRVRIFTGKTGRRYLSAILIDGPDQCGNDGLFNSSAQAFDAAKRVAKNDQRKILF
jgi:hypothetical protein